MSACLSTEVNTAVFKTDVSRTKIFSTWCILEILNCHLCATGTSTGAIHSIIILKSKHLIKKLEIRACNFLIVDILKPYLVYDLKFNNPVWN